jgi:hypothetical protein
MTVKGTDGHMNMREKVELIGKLLDELYQEETSKGKTDMCFTQDVSEMKWRLDNRLKPALANLGK